MLAVEKHNCQMEVNCQKPLLICCIYTQTHLCQGVSHLSKDRMTPAPIETVLFHLRNLAEMQSNRRSRDLALSQR